LSKCSFLLFLEIVKITTLKIIINKINSYFGYKLINEIKLQTFNSRIRKTENKNSLYKFSENFNKKINEIKNKNIRNSLSQLLKAIKND